MRRVILFQFFGSRLRLVLPAHGFGLWSGHGWGWGQPGVAQTLGARGI